MRPGAEAGAVSSRFDVSLKSQFLILNIPRLLTPSLLEVMFVLVGHYISSGL